MIDFGCRIVTKEGVNVHGATYWSSELDEIIGKPLRVGIDEADAGHVHLFDTRTGQFVARVPRVGENISPEIYPDHFAKGARQGTAGSNTRSKVMVVKLCASHSESTPEGESYESHQVAISVAPEDQEIVEETLRDLAEIQTELESLSGPEKKLLGRGLRSLFTMVEVFSRPPKGESKLCPSCKMEIEEDTYHYCPRCREDLTPLFTFRCPQCGFHTLRELGADDHGCPMCGKPIQKPLPEEGTGV